MSLQEGEMHVCIMYTCMYMYMYKHVHMYVRVHVYMKIQNVEQKGVGHL